MAITSKSILLSIIFNLHVISCVLSQPETQFLHHGFLGANLLKYGTARIHSNGLLELTNTSKRQMGQAFYGFPISFLNPNSSESVSFYTSYVFAIVSESSDPPGHGLAFVISPSMDFSQALPTQYLGLFNVSDNGNSSNHIVAVEFDTVETIEFVDINDNHVGIDLNGLISLESSAAAYLDSQEMKNKSLKLADGDPIQVWIEYDRTQMLLNVTLAPLGHPRPSIPLMSRKLNLSAILAEEMYVGFSASTGTVTSNHYILGWSFSREEKAQDFDISKLPSLPVPPPSPSPPSISSDNKKRNNLKLIVICIASTTVLVILMIFLGCFIFRRRQTSSGGPRRFSHTAISKATDGFDSSTLLGEERTGNFYKGVLLSKERIAIKKVTCKTRHQKKTLKTEIDSIARLTQRNLAHLLGHCSRRSEILLVYEYMPNGSLDNFLFSTNRPNLHWSDRFKIIKGIASALFYLHEECQRTFLHRNVKASNVLLDEDLKARLGDFGSDSISSSNSNTGHMAPELIETGKENRGTDVFAFGVLMLEIVCGRRAIEPRRPPEEISLINWVVQGFKKGDLMKRCDPRIEDNFTAREVLLVLKLGLLCSNQFPQARPAMKKVTQYLDGTERLPHDDYLFFGM